jgi:hypothetical protein
MPLSGATAEKCIQRESEQTDDHHVGEHRIGPQCLLLGDDARAEAVWVPSPPARPAPPPAMRKPTGMAAVAAGERYLAKNGIEHLDAGE